MELSDEDIRWEGQTLMRRTIGGWVPFELTSTMLENTEDESEEKKRLLSFDLMLIFAVCGLVASSFFAYIFLKYQEENVVGQAWPISTQRTFTDACMKAALGDPAVSETIAQIQCGCVLKGATSNITIGEIDRFNRLGGLASKTDNAIDKIQRTCQENPGAFG